MATSIALLPKPERPVAVTGALLGWGSQRRRAEKQRPTRSQSTSSLSQKLPAVAVSGGLAASSRRVTFYGAQGSPPGQRRRAKVVEDEEEKNGAAQRSRRLIFEQARRVVEATRPKIEAAEQELNERHEALDECREAVEACNKKLMATSLRLEDRGYHLAAAWCERSPEVKRLRAKAAELTLDSDKVSRRVMKMSYEMEQEREEERLWEEERLSAAGSPEISRPWPESSYASPSPKGRRLFPDSESKLDVAEWSPMECYHRRTTTDLLGFANLAT
eukprot:TRINITY_DN51609_c0_g1_i1.p1 TRINITY_DN51609_c0_g1~~TRINITY_DN51609_c0_g1_i1.p1  ORF type:complete len:275 (+),score=65.00 TRINITY_DN51609_c0_g1_i1:33-857(+)